MNGAWVAILIVLIAIGGITAITIGYYRLQQHRADAVALAGYRRLAEDASTAQLELQTRLDTLDGRLAAIEKLLRDVQ